MSMVWRSLFSMTVVFAGSACDTGAGADSTSTAQAGSGGDGSDSTASDASGEVTTLGATSTESALGPDSSGATSMGGGGGISTALAMSTSAAMSTVGVGDAGSGGTTSSGGSGAGGSGGAPLTACDDAALVWKSGRKTNYTSYPDPGSEECVVYNGCMWAGWFAHCDDQQSEAWVETHDIAAMFPDSGYELHDICLRSGERTMIVTVYDTCGDDDCDGCCTENKGTADALIDLESFTNARWGLPDGELEWADLGPTSSNACE